MTDDDKRRERENCRGEVSSPDYLRHDPTMKDKHVVGAPSPEIC